MVFFLLILAFFQENMIFQSNLAHLRGKHDVFTIIGYFMRKQDISPGFGYMKILTNKKSDLPTLVETVNKQTNVLA